MADGAQTPKDIVSIALTVNGAARTVAVDPFQSLATALRDGLGLIGTKVGCDAGDCGACTVILDGEQVCACLVSAAQADGAAVETVEGAGPDGITDRLRRAFLEHGAAQCGICTPGMLMAATDVLAREPGAGREAVEDALGGVLCRCTGYVKILDAVMSVAGEVDASKGVGGPPSRTMTAWGGESDGGREDRCVGGPPSRTMTAWDVESDGGRADKGVGGPPSRTMTARVEDGDGGRVARDEGDGGFLSVGRRIARLDGWGKVAGTEVFGADAAPAEALWVRVLRSPYARATFAIGDLESVRSRVPGLEAIVTARDVPGENSFGIFPTTKDQPVFADGHVRFRGEAIAALVGTKEAVESVSDADLPIAWTVLPPLTGVEAALAAEAPALHAGSPGNVLTRGYLKRGDAETGHQGAAATAEGRFETAFVEHAYIEPEAGFAEPVGDRMEVSACTQAPYMDLEETARVLGVAHDKVRIRPTACGGGFGGKLDASIQPILAVAAHATGRPVRIVYSRAESMASTTKRHPAKIRARYSADADGRFMAFDMDGDFNTGAYASWGPTVANRVPVHATGPYRVPHVTARTRAVYTNETPSGAFRGFGVPQAAIAHETLIDDLAEKLGLDRWEIRRRNAIGTGDETATGQRLASAGLPQCLDALKPEWEAGLARAAEWNRGEGRVRRGVGIACMWYGCGNTSLPNPSTMRITLSRDGRLTFHNGAVDIGQGSTTVLTQIAAEALGVPAEAFRLVVGDTDLTADAGKTSASRQTLVSGNAARLAGEALRKGVLSLANAGPEARISIAEGVLTIADGEATRRIEISSLPADEAGVVLAGEGTWDPPTSPLDAEGQGVPYASYGFAAQMAEVAVDTALGTVKVLAIHAAHDVGRAINPTLTEGQIHGGIAQGLGLALMEEFIPGRTENLHDYLIPTVGDMPEMTIHLIEDPEPVGPFGAKGVGEPALVATAPAILSAIRHATGARMTRVPVLPHRLWEALQEGGR
ncbi:molybdopterin-dependent oxidoreductase [Chthonobacter albigriseus]|uniref:molybdopterin-dependent oxidoreductase n=1 Tax=Chthonobacter albigriseus TaxID=1683161 RepID=UPI0015EF01CD|nr:molybdopterin cofactor-binding domain-containing protein [Chthonobacter albigriseus]